MKILLSGAMGHMGRAVAELAGAQPDTVIAGGVDPCGGSAGFPLWTRFDEAPSGIADAVIDFSRPESLDDLLRWCLRENTPAVLATTGYTDAQLRAIGAAAERIPVFRSANMSLGIAVLKALSRRAAGILGPGWDIEITETHHRRKADAPSGTALLLADALKDLPGRTGVVYGREGRRAPGEIGVSALRGGTVVGEHTVAFFGEQERICLSHSAESRGVFAAGALRAAAFLTGRPAGLYSMDDLTAALIG